MQQVQQHAVERETTQIRREEARGANSNQHRIIGADRNEAEQHDSPGSAETTEPEVPSPYAGAQAVRRHASPLVFALSKPVGGIYGRLGQHTVNITVGAAGIPAALSGQDAMRQA